MAIISSISGLTRNSATINGMSDGPAYQNWDYQLNGGAWASMGAGPEVTSASRTITGLTENTTYTYAVRAYNPGGPVETSFTKSFTTPKSTTAPSVSAVVSNIGTDRLTITGTANYTCKTWQYSLNDGSTWASLSASTSATSVSKVITGLTPATLYQVRVRATRTYNNAVGTSSRVNATTVGGSVLNYVNTVNADAATVKLIINWTIHVASYTHTLRIKDGETVIVTITGLTGTTGAETIELTPVQRTALLAAFPDKKSFLATFELQTLSGGTQVGARSSKTATVQTSEEWSGPTFTGFVLSEQNAKVTAVNPGGFVQGLSDIQALCDTATAKNGASIVRYGMTVAGKTVYSNDPLIEFGAPTGCGEDLPVSVWATDSRGYATGMIQLHTVWCYSVPEALTWEARRRNSVEAVTSLKVLGTIRTVPNNALKKAQARIKVSMEAWGAWEDLPGLDNVGIVTPGRRGYEYDDDEWQELDPEKSYVIQVRFQDLFDEWSDPISLSVPRGIPLMSFRDGKVGINQPNPQAGLDVVDHDTGGIIVNGQLIKDDIQAKVDQLVGVRGYSGIVSAGSTASVTVSQAARALLVAVIPQGSTATANHALSVVMIYNASFGQVYPLKTAANVTVGVSGYTISISPTVASTYRIIEF